MIRLITIEREFGCGGGEIARKVAEHLGWNLWDQALTNEIARIAETDPDVIRQREERRDPIYYRLFKAFLRGSYEGSQNMHRLKLVDADGILSSTRQALEGLCDCGNCVIVGRGSQHFLQDRKDTLRVFLYASREEKIRRLISRGESEDRAQELVETIDNERAAFIGKYFNVEWPNRTLYHAMINTGAGDEIVVRLILNLAAALES